MTSLCLCAAHDEAVSVGQSSGQRLELRRDVLGQRPPARAGLAQPDLSHEEALLQQRHRSAQVPPLRRITGTQILDRREHVPHRQQQQHAAAAAGTG